MLNRHDGQAEQLLTKVPNSSELWNNDVKINGWIQST